MVMILIFFARSKSEIQLISFLRDVVEKRATLREDARDLKLNVVIKFLFRIVETFEVANIAQLPKYVITEMGNYFGYFEIFYTLLIFWLMMISYMIYV